MEAVENTSGPDVPDHLDRTLANLLSYLKSKSPGLNDELLKKAVSFSINAHKNQFRKSGTPYTEHPFEVAKILASYKMDTVTIVAGLLHDVVEDTDTTIEEIKNEFGEYVSFLVESVTKISAIQMKSKIERQAETFRKMLLSMVKDFRVILIKFADRLHNMRTLGYMKEEKKKAIAMETLEVYAPMAHRFGLAAIRWELEDLAFKNLNPNAYKQIVQKVVKRRNERESLIRSLIQSVKDTLNKAGLKCQVLGRSKHFYSIYKKMQRRKCRLEDVYDLFALRIITRNIEQCYSALGIVHGLWPPLQTRFKDYISTPKSNMYQSLHTTLISSDGKPVEIQIRTDKMDKTAEYGIAAHWAYKEKRSPDKIKQESKWLEQFINWQKDLTDSAQFMDFFRIDLKSDEIFVFSPRGDLLQLPAGSTALDFAFEVHTQVGIHCSGAKVDGKMVPLDKVLSTGSTVEIIKTPEQHPSSDWLRIVTTAKAKYSIRKWLKKEEYEKSLMLGKELLFREFRNMNISEKDQKEIGPFSNNFGTLAWEDLYNKIGTGQITLGALSSFLRQLYPDKKRGMFQNIRFKASKDKAESVLVSGAENLPITFSSCCQPIPGDKIIGSVTEGKGVSIHRARCPEGIKLLRDKERIIPVMWNDIIGQTYDAFIEIQGRDRPGLLNDIVKLLTQHEINIYRASIVTVDKQVRNKFMIQVTSLFQLENAFADIEKIKGIRNVIRKQPGRSRGSEPVPDFE